MYTVRLCKNCGRLPYEDIYSDYSINRMVFRFYCPHCGATGIHCMSKEEAILDWNKRCETEHESKSEI